MIYAIIKNEDEIDVHVKDRDGDYFENKIELELFTNCEITIKRIGIGFIYDHQIGTFQKLAETKNEFNQEDVNLMYKEVKWAIKKELTPETDPEYFL